MTSGTPIEIFIAPPVNQDTAALLQEIDYRASQIIAMPETTQLKCKKCEGVTEHAYYYLVIANADVISGRKAIYVCINDGTTTVANVKD